MLHISYILTLKGTCGPAENSEEKSDLVWIQFYCVYQDFHLNRVVLEEGGGAEASPAGARPKKKTKKMYDLTAADRFWQKHKGRSVPDRCVCLSTF